MPHAFQRKGGIQAKQNFAKDSPDARGAALSGRMERERDFQRLANIHESAFLSPDAEEAEDTAGTAEKNVGGIQLKIKVTGKNFGGIHKAYNFLAEAVFVDCDFRNASFYYSIMGRAKFINCDLTGAEFNACDLYGAEFKGSRMVGARVIGCHLGEANFEDVDISWAEFCGSAIEAHTFKGAKGAELSNMTRKTFQGRTIRWHIASSTKRDEDTPRRDGMRRRELRREWARE